MLQILANEILLELFEFLDATERFRAFHNLNNRFNTILFTHYQLYRVNFHSVLKYESELLSRHYLQLIADQIVSLHLSDNYDESPPQTDLFFSSGLLLTQFRFLQSLSLCHIYVEKTLHRLIIDCCKLSYLIHLKIINCHSYYIKSVSF